MRRAAAVNGGRPTPLGVTRAACRCCQWRACYPGNRPPPLGGTRFDTAQWIGKKKHAFRRAGARPRRSGAFPIAPTKLHRTKAFPLGGRWPGEAGSDEGPGSVFTTSGEKTNVAAPYQSKIKDFCQLLPREKPNPLRHGLRRATSPRGRGKGCGVSSPARSAACCCSPPGSGEGLCCGEEMINLSQKPGGSRNKSRGKLVNMSI